MKKQKIVVGMSGGVDSSVVAAILKQQGHEVIGLFMKNWDEQDDNGECSATQDFNDVARVADQLDIPYYALEFVKEYRDRVFQSFVEGYQNGLTPNPDILCNREIKFDLMLKQAKDLGADYLATGHYCQKVSILGNDMLAKGVDQNKDQSYFVYTLKQNLLKDVIFPLGHMTKPTVRMLAQKFNLPTQDKKDSTGICFIGERKFRKFLSEFIAFQPGCFKTLDGTIVGEHCGSAFYTLGQRKGLGLGGQGAPWFVVDKCVQSNTVFVERGEDHPALYTDRLWTELPSWVVDNMPAKKEVSLKCKLRYRQSDQGCRIRKNDDGELEVLFDSPQRAITPGQSIVFYQTWGGHEVCLGGAVIKKADQHFYHRGLSLKSWNRSDLQFSVS